jgi:hypothetical protein
MASQAGDETVTLAQKLHTERLGSVIHDVWDVHTDKARWWVITNPTNLYTQEQFPNMDLALTFHMGLCLRIPRQDRAGLDGRWAEPFVACFRGLEDARDALSRSEEVEDFQAIGMRSREVLVHLMNAVQELVAPEVPEPHPKGSDVTAWSDTAGDLLFAGSSNENRRRLAKKAVQEAWVFTNWLAHAHGAGPDDADSAVDVTTLAVSIFSTALIRRIRGVPEGCPECGSLRLSPERASDPDDPGSTYERPACGRCAWRGTPVLVRSVSAPPSAPHTGDCVVMSRPLLRTRPAQRPLHPRKRRK